VQALDLGLQRLDLTVALREQLPQAIEFGGCCGSGGQAVRGLQMRGAETVRDGGLAQDGGCAAGQKEAKEERDGETGVRFHMTNLKK